MFSRTEEGWGKSGSGEILYVKFVLPSHQEPSDYLTVVQCVKIPVSILLRGQFSTHCKSKSETLSQPEPASLGQVGYRQGTFLFKASTQRTGPEAAESVLQILHRNKSALSACI